MKLYADCDYSNEKRDDKYGRHVQLKNRFPQVFNPKGYRHHLDCNLFRMKNPTVVAFVCDDIELEGSSNVYAAVVGYTQETLFPTYIIELSSDEDRAWAVEKFGIDDTFPSICIWSMGKMRDQFNPATGHYPSYITQLYIKEQVMHNIIMSNDVKGYRLHQYYETLKEQEESEV